jgi:hypothetical protein
MRKSAEERYQTKIYRQERFANGLFLYSGYTFNDDKKIKVKVIRDTNIRAVVFIAQVKMSCACCHSKSRYDIPVALN